MIRLLLPNIILLLLCSSCSSPSFFTKKEKEELNLRFYLEASRTYPGQSTVIKTLPFSGIQIPVFPVPIISEQLIFNAEVVQVSQGICALFQLNPTGSRILYRTSVNHRGSRIVFEKDGVTLGSLVLSETMADGNLFIFSEMSDQELGDLIIEIRTALNPQAYQGSSKSMNFKAQNVPDEEPSRRNISK